MSDQSVDDLYQSQYFIASKEALETCYCGGDLSSRGNKVTRNFLPRILFASYLRLRPYSSVAVLFRAPSKVCCLGLKPLHGRVEMALNGSKRVLGELGERKDLVELIELLDKEVMPARRRQILGCDWLGLGLGLLLRHGVKSTVHQLTFGLPIVLRSGPWRPLMWTWG